MTDEIIVNLTKVEEKIQYHLKEAKRLQDFLDLAKTFQFDNQEQPGTVISSTVATDTNMPLTGTFKEVIKRIFESEDRPLTIKIVMSIYTARTGKPVIYNTFSGQFSGLVTRDSLLKKQVFTEKPIESRNVYGLSQWFNEDGNTLKEEYRNKIK